MKLNSIILGLLLQIAAACTDIDYTDRFVEVEQPVASKSVLALDFTGQWCVNCPQASQVLAETVQAYGADTLICVSIYLPYVIDVAAMQLHSADGFYYAQSLGLDGYSAPWLNIDLDATRLSDNYNLWRGLIAEQMSADPVEIDLTATATYNASANTLSLSAEAHGNADGDLRLLAWVVEDKVEALQAMPDGSFDMQHEHNNVFRLAMESRNGVPLSIGNTTNIDATLSTDWNVENLKIVMIIVGVDGKALVAKVLRQLAYE